MKKLLNNFITRLEADGDFALGVYFIITISFLSLIIGLAL